MICTVTNKTRDCIPFLFIIHGDRAEVYRWGTFESTQTDMKPAESYSQLAEEISQPDQMASSPTHKSAPTVY